MILRTISLALFLLLVGCTSRSAGGEHIPTLPAATLARPSAETFLIEIGTVISDGRPERGAGNIELPQSADIYIFQLESETEIHFDALGQNAPLQWTLTDVDGIPIFANAPLTANTDPGTLALDAGTYIITVTGESNTAAGTYQFQLTSTNN